MIKYKAYIPFYHFSTRRWCNSLQSKGYLPRMTNTSVCGELRRKDKGISVHEPCYLEYCTFSIRNVNPRELQKLLFFPQPLFGHHNKTWYINSAQIYDFLCKSSQRRVMKYFITSGVKDIESGRTEARRVVRPCTGRRRVWGCTQGFWSEQCTDDTHLYPLL